MTLSQQLLAVAIVVLIFYQLAKGFSADNKTLLDDQSRLTYQNIYRDVWSTVPQLYLHREALNNWNDFAEPPTWRTIGDAERSIASLIANLGDKYSYVDTSVNPTLRSRNREQSGVASSKMSNGIGYVKLSTFFSARAAIEMEAEMQKLRHARGFILDLRDNGGGCTMECLQIYSLFVNSGVLKTMVGYTDGKPSTSKLELTEDYCVCEEDEQWSRPRFSNIAGNKPLVVLINEGSASAAEVLAAALRSRPNTLLIGAKSVGKGVSLRVVEFDQGINVALVHSRSTPPDGVCYDKIGITPEWVVAGRNAQLRAAHSALTNFFESTSPSYALA